MSRTVELRIGGQSYRVVSSAPEEELQHLATVLNQRLAEISGNRTASDPIGARPLPQGLLLVAMALAHEIEEEREQRKALEDRVRDLLGGLLSRIDGALSSPAESARD